MCLDLTGTTNDNEFYSAHYLREVLGAQDLSDRVKTKRAKDGEVPRWEALQKYRRNFLKQPDRFKATRQHKKTRLRFQRKTIRNILGILGYEWAPRTEMLN